MLNGIKEIEHLEFIGLSLNEQSLAMIAIGIKGPPDNLPPNLQEKKLQMIERK